MLYAHISFVWLWQAALRTGVCRPQVNDNSKVHVAIYVASVLLSVLQIRFYLIHLKIRMT